MADRTVSRSPRRLRHASDTVRLPAWPRRIGMLRLVATVIAVVAVAADLAVFVSVSGPVAGYVAFALSSAGVLLTWRHPWSGLALTMAGCAVIVFVGWDATGLWTVVVFCLFIAVLAGASAVITGGVTALALYLLIAFVADGGATDPAGVIASVAAVAGAGVGGALRAQWRYWTVLEQRAAQALAAREREGELEVVAERLRIARDLHDVVGHEIAVLNMHLGVAELSLSDAEQTREALRKARAAVQSVLAETQSILGVLRRTGGTGLHDAPPGPTPGICHVPELIASFRQIGLRIDAQLDPDTLVGASSAVGLAAYRITQEALTNAYRHGGGRVEVEIASPPGLSRLVITVTNLTSTAVSAPASEHAGHGLIGMRERAESLGGRLEIVRDKDVFRLRAELPYESISRRD